MDHETFVNAVYKYVAKPAVADALQAVESPSENKSPKAATFNNFTDREKALCRDIAKDAVDAAFFGLFCVLDGVRNIDDVINASRLRLILETDTETFVLSDNTEYPGLHDTYNHAAQSG
jgi:hypothetical protein